MSRFDVSPPGWGGSVEAMKKHGSIDQPFALAWWMSEQGFKPHDAMDRAVLDAACEMAMRQNYEDGTPYQSGGAKAPTSPTNYEKETTGEEPWGTEVEGTLLDDDDSDLLMEHEQGSAPGHKVHAFGHGQAGAHEEENDDEEKLLDDSEVGPGEDLPQEHATAITAPWEEGPDDPPTKEPNLGVHRTISDPAPEVSGAQPISVEGEETNDEDENEEEEEDKY